MTNQALNDIQSEAKLFVGLVRAHLPAGVRAEIAFATLEAAIYEIEIIIRDWADLKRVFDKPATCDRRD